MSGMKPTPRTEEVLNIQHNWGAIRDAAGGVEDGVTPQEAHESMVQALERLSRDLERQLSDALEREKALVRALKRIQDKPNNTMSDAKALREIMRIATAAIAQNESGDEPTYTDCPIHGRHEGDCPRC